MYKKLVRLKRNPFGRIFPEKQTIFKGKCWNQQQIFPPPTATTKMAEKYKANCQKIKW